MSTNHRIGNSDTTKDSGLAAHWAVASILLVAQAIATVYTQYNQHRLGWEKRVKFQNIGNIWEVDVVLLALYLFPFMTLSSKAGNSQHVSCELYMVWAQLTGAVALGMLMYRSLLFAYRVAQIERARIHHTESAPKYQPTPSELVRTKKRKKTIDWAIKHLEPWRLKIGSFIIFILAGGPLIFAYKENRDYALGKSDQCSGRPAALTTVLWYVWVIPFACIASKIIQTDPYQVLHKLKIQTFGITVAFAIFLPLSFTMDRDLGTAHAGLLSYELYAFFWASVWYSESYLPLRLTLQKIRENNELSQRKMKYDIVDVLADPDLLYAFESHLIKEWAVENLEFYKCITLFDLHLATQIKKIEAVYKKGPKKEKEFASLVGMVFKVESARAMRIYHNYIMDGAHSQVNLPAKTVKPIHSFFREEIFEPYRPEHSVSSHVSGISTMTATNHNLTGTISKQSLPHNHPLSSTFNKDNVAVTSPNNAAVQASVTASPAALSPKDHQISGHSQGDLQEEVSQGIEQHMLPNDLDDHEPSAIDIDPRLSVNSESRRSSNHNHRVSPSAGTSNPVDSATSFQHQSIESVERGNGTPASPLSPVVGGGGVRSSMRATSKRTSARDLQIKVNVGPEPLDRASAGRIGSLKSGHRKTTSVAELVLNLGRKPSPGVQVQNGRSGSQLLPGYRGNNHSFRSKSMHSNESTLDEKQSRFAPRRIKSQTSRRRTLNPRLKANVRFSKAIANTASFMQDFKTYAFLDLPNRYHNTASRDGFSLWGSIKDRKAIYKSSHSDMSQIRDYAELISQIEFIAKVITIFHSAKGEAFTLMQKDSFKRFIASIAIVSRASLRKRKSSKSPTSRRSTEEKKSGTPFSMKFWNRV
ncbi:hypothetical protein AAMO2058_000812600 [Amorphochlora amoebiformis]